MAATTFGWAGTVNESQFATLSVLTQPQDYAKLTLTDWTVTAVSGQRAVSVSPGTAGGEGAWTTTDAAEVATIATTPTNGQWFLLVRNRNWPNKISAFTLRAHATTAVGAAGATPSTFPSTVKTQPGVEDDVPVAWVWANSANTNLTIVPILRPTRVLPRRGTTAQRDAFYGTPGTNVSLQAGLAYQEWFNTDNEWLEIYLPGRDAGTAPDIARPAGWYPIWGALPFVEADNAGATQGIANSTATVLRLSRITARGGFTSVTSGVGHGLVTPFAGKYAAHAFGVWDQAVGGNRELTARYNSSPFAYSQIFGAVAGTPAADAGVAELVCTAGGTWDFRVYQNRTDSSGAGLNFTVTRASLAYLGPI